MNLDPQPKNHNDPGYHTDPGYNNDAGYHNYPDYNFDPDHDDIPKVGTRMYADFASEEKRRSQALKSQVMYLNMSLKLTAFFKCFSTHSTLMLDIYISKKCCIPSIKTSILTCLPHSTPGQYSLLHVNIFHSGDDKWQAWTESLWLPALQPDGRCISEGESLVQDGCCGSLVRSSANTEDKKKMKKKTKF